MAFGFGSAVAASGRLAGTARYRTDALGPADDAAAAPAERVSRLRLAIVDWILTERCPDCGAAFADYDG